MSRNRKILSFALIVLIVILLSVSFMWATRTVWVAGSRGTMFVNDSGVGYGSGGWNATYDVALDSYTKGPKTLKVSISEGNDDRVQLHSFTLRSWEIGYDTLTLVSDGWTMLLVRNQNASGIGEYIAEWSPSNAQEQQGQIRPSWFGLPDTYYLRMELGPIAVA